MVIGLGQLNGHSDVKSAIGEHRVCHHDRVAMPKFRIKIRRAKIRLNDFDLVQVVGVQIFIRIKPLLLQSVNRGDNRGAPRGAANGGSDLSLQWDR